MSTKPPSSIIHHEDGGLVYSSIRNDGTIIHWCDTCGRYWVSKEQSESELPKNVLAESRMIVMELKEKLESVGAYV